MKNRIREIKTIKGAELLSNPKNWRNHPPQQAAALNGVLDEVGIANTLLAYETQDGLVLIDGHLRVKEHPDAEWPVVVLDVDEREADLLLASIDPLSAMAYADKGMLDALLREIDTGNAEVQQMLADLAEREGLYPDEEDGEDGEEDGEGTRPNPIIQYALIFDNEEQQKRWYDFLRRLKERYPEGTIAGRLMRWLEQQGEADEPL